MTCATFTFAQARAAARRLGVVGLVPVRVLRTGMNVEREHRDIGACRSPTLAAHIRERPDYYVRLRRYVEKR
jgi:hypothetical protein